MSLWSSFLLQAANNIKCYQLGERKSNSKITQSHYLVTYLFTHEKVDQKTKSWVRSYVQLGIRKGQGDSTIDGEFICKLWDIWQI